MLILACILLGLFEVLLGLGGLLLTKVWVGRKEKQIHDALLEEARKLLSGEPCQTAMLLNTAGRVVGSEAGKSAKASLMADLSHVAKLGNSIEQETAIGALAESNPAIGGILSALPKGKGSKLLKNPLIQLALSGIFNRNSSNNPPSNGGAKIKSFEM